MKGSSNTNIHRPIAQWTADDIGFVIDMVRDQMPQSPPDGWCVRLLRDQADSFPDGRALHSSLFGRKPTSEGSQSFLWFSTAAGYSARVYLPSCPPAHALVSFVCASSSVFELRIDLDRRLARRRAEGVTTAKPLSKRSNRKDGALPQWGAGITPWALILARQLEVLWSIEQSAIQAVSLFVRRRLRKNGHLLPAAEANALDRLLSQWDGGAQ